MLRTSLTIAAIAAFAPSLHAQGSSHALRFFGTGNNQQDRVRIPIDDDLAGPDASSPCDVGAGSFTIEFWVRGQLADNPTTNWGGDVEQANVDWILGNIVVDRDIWGPSSRDFGISIAGGFVRFGTGHADVAAQDGDHTLEGSTSVLDGNWHHVACVRDATSGIKRIYVDTVLDVASTPNASRDDISYPNGGVPGAQTPWGPYLVVGAEKHDAGPGYPSFSGRVDELRVWSVARSADDLLGSFQRVVASNSPGLVGMFRFEEGSGTSIADSSAAQNPAGQLIAGQPGNGEWTAWAQNTTNTAPIGQGVVPPGFTKTTVASGLGEPTTLAFLPDGRLLIGERGGRILVVQNGQLLQNPLCQLQVDTTFGERGLSGIAVDPDFVNTGHIFVFTTSTEPRARVVRLDVIGNSADPQTGVVLWQHPQLAGTFHHGGDLAFAADGTLLLSTGDQTQAASSQNLGSANGKILRIAKDGTIPNDNPFVGTPGVLPEIWAYGLRNPFRIHVDPASGRVYIGDVGANGPNAIEELNVGVSGANYGWPDQEGSTCHVGTCSGMSAPLFAYAHSNASYSSGQTQGCIIGGPVYRATAFPPEYQGNVFVAEYSNRWIRRLVLDNTGAVIAAPEFQFAPDAGPVVDLEVGPDGALWVLTYGLSFPTAQDIGAVHRIEWTGTANVAPTAIATVDLSGGAAPLGVQFSSAGSFDADNGPSALTYAWDFGDGQTSTQANPAHTYLVAGPYTATLTVSDGLANTVAAPLSILVGNAPVATITTPAEHALYRAGDVIAFAGTATDVEDGTLPASAFTWQVQLIHDDHVHPFFGPITGVAGGQFSVPSTGHTPEDSHYRIRLDVVDSNGLVDSASVDLEPRLATLVIDSVPQGISFTIDGEPATTPHVLESIEAFQHVLAMPAAVSIGAQASSFVCWSDGGAREHTVVTPAGGQNVTAFYGVAPQGTVAVSVPAVVRNANYIASVGTLFSNNFDLFGLCFGRDTSGFSQVGLEFPLAVPAGATIVSARIDAIATNDQFGQPQAVLRAFDLASAPQFASGPTPLTSLHPLTSASVGWSPSAFAPGASVSSPDLAALVQELVDRPDWNAGNFVGFVLDGQSTVGDGWRCIRNFQSGQAPTLHVSYATQTSVGCGQACGFASYGVGFSPAHHLGLLGSGQPSVGGMVTLGTSGVVAPTVVLFLAAQPSTLPVVGGALLVNPSSLLTVVGLPVVDGRIDVPFTIPSDSALAGTAVYLQAVAPDPSDVEGYAFSSGLALTICP